MSSLVGWVKQLLNGKLPTLRKPANAGKQYFDYGVNIFDFVCLVSFIGTLFTSAPGNDIFLAFSVLSAIKPFKLLTLTPGLQLLTNSLLLCAKLLYKVLIFMAFFYACFGILGVQLFRGTMARRCVIPQMAANGTILDRLVALPE